MWNENEYFLKEKTIEICGRNEESSEIIHQKILKSKKISILPYNRHLLGTISNSYSEIKFIEVIKGIIDDIDFTRFPNLTSLYLGDVSGDFRNFWSKIPHLKFLSIRIKSLDTYFPFEIIDNSDLFQELEVLNISTQSHSPEPLPQSLPNLREFQLVNNKINTLKGFPTYLPNLESLILNGNILESLEGFPSNLPNLKRLELQGNRLQQISLKKSQLPNLLSIQLDENPLKTFEGFPLGSYRFEIDNDKIISLHGLSKDLMISNYNLLLQVESLPPTARNLIQAREFDLLEQYYSSPVDLLAIRLTKHEQLKETELERLSYEGGKEELLILKESDLPISHPVIKAITTRLLEK